MGFSKSFTSLFAKCKPGSESISLIAPNCKIISIKYATVDRASAFMYNFAITYLVVAHAPTKIYKFPMGNCLVDLLSQYNLLQIVEMVYLSFLVTLVFNHKSLFYPIFFFIISWYIHLVLYISKFCNRNY